MIKMIARVCIDIVYTFCNKLGKSIAMSTAF